MLNKKKFIPCIRSLFTDNIPQNGNVDLSNADPSLIFYAPFKSNLGYWTKDRGWDDASYVRTSSQTYISPVNRILRIASANVPAVGRYGVELDGARTNLLQYSEDFTRWSKNTSAITVSGAGAAILPTGTSSYLYLLSVAVSPAAGDAFTGSIDIYGSGRLAINLVESGGGYSDSDLAGWNNTYVDLDPNSVNRITATGSVVNAGRNKIIFRLRSDTGCEITAIGPRGAQLQTGSLVTAYIPTNGAAATQTTSASDTSGNGLSIALSQRMLDSLKGEMIDWKTAWTYDQSSSYYAVSGKTITCDASGNSLIRMAYKGATLDTGKTYEISYTVSGLAGGMRVFMGNIGNIATTALPLITANGTYIAREIATNGTTFGVRFNDGASGSVTINYCRRVLTETTGQVNRGEGTLIQWVYLPWDSIAVPNNTTIPSSASPDTNSTRGVHLYRNPAGVFNAARLVDGVNTAAVSIGEIQSGRYALISQWSAASSRMRCGYYDPSTGVTTWSHSTLAGGATYRGFFPIHLSNKLRWFYDGKLPLGIGSCALYNSILSDDEILRAARKLQ